MLWGIQYHFHACIVKDNSKPQSDICIRKGWVHLQVSISNKNFEEKNLFLSIAQLQLGQGLAGYLHQIGTGLNWASHKLNFWIETPEMEDLFVLQNCAKLFCFPNLVCSPESEPWKGLSLFHWIWLSVPCT